MDFGFARLKPENSDSAMLTPCFTLHYAAPEVLRQTQQQQPQSQESDVLERHGYDESCDLWSLGVILYTMLSGKAPFQSGSREVCAATIMSRIKGGEFSFTGPEWTHVSLEARQLIQGLLTVNPRYRLSMRDLENNDWLNQGPMSTTSAAQLATPEVLAAGQTARLQKSLKTTLGAFRQATREGFRLQVKDIHL